MLIILAGITLNAVIGEDGIIFQAKDTKNMISNETQYDNQQLAQLQNELKDNQLYSGIGIIPGTDTGGGSEGGENGTSGGNQGGSNIGTNTGGDTNNRGNLVNTNNSQGPIIGGDAQDPIIRVLEGEMVAASFYRSDVTIQIYTEDRTQRIKYVLTSTVEEINNELYPSGLIRELDIENGGTLTFTKDGEYTITAYAYDTQGQKSNPVVMWFKRQTGGTTGSGITLTPTGNIGDNDWYTSNVTIRILGTDAGSTRITYRVTGIAYERGMIGNYEYEAGEIIPREIEIANGTTLRIAVDGEYTITAYSYDAGNTRISLATLNIKRDATRPVIHSFTGEQVIQDNIGQGFQVSIDAIDTASSLTSMPYTYKYKLATVATYDEATAVADKSKLYVNLDQMKTYDMYVIVKDEAGNKVASDIISKPAFWISSNPNQSEGERLNEGKEGSLQYTRSPNIEFSFKGQDSTNVDISKIEYQVEGIATEEGTIEGTSYSKDQPVNQTKEYFSSSGQDKIKQTLNLAIDGDWTVKVHTYNKEGKKVTTNVIRICRDTIAPTVRTFEVTSTSETTADAVVTNDSFGVSGQRTGGGYTYFLGDNSQETKMTTMHGYTGLTRTSNYATSLRITTKDKAGNTSTINPTDTIYYLVDRVAIGDYVALNVGKWTETKAPPTMNADIGGFSEGMDKANGIAESYDGWRVAWKEGGGFGGSVSLISAGAPFLTFFGSNISDFNEMKQLKEWVSMEYSTGEFISSVDIVDENVWNRLSDDVKRGGGEYWLFKIGASGSYACGLGETLESTDGWWWSPNLQTSYTSARSTSMRKFTTLKSGTFMSFVGNEGTKGYETAATITYGGVDSYWIRGNWDGAKPSHSFKYHGNYLVGSLVNVFGAQNCTKGVRCLINLEQGAKTSEATKDGEWDIF